MIKSLNISYCKQITNMGVNAALNELDNASLECLNIESIGSSGGTSFYAANGFEESLNEIKLNDTTHGNATNELKNLKK